MFGTSLDCVLDVTLRDGGYLNRWDFEKPEVYACIDFLLSLGLSNIEVGFLKPPAASRTDVYGCQPDFLAELKERTPDLSLVAILNGFEEDWRGALAGRVPYLSVLRVPSIEAQIEKAITISETAKSEKSDIRTSINLICIANYTQAELRQAVQRVARSEAVDMLYFADSFGALLPGEVSELYRIARDHCDNILGFHAHDTLGNAIANCDAALQNGCRWVDVSMNGFGLGGGNTSLGAFLDHHRLGSVAPETEKVVAAFCAAHCSLRHPDADTSEWYRRFAAKGVDTMWLDALRAQFAETLAEKISAIPRQRYKTIESVIEAF